MQQESIPTYIRNNIKRSGVIGQLIAINVIVFLLVAVISIIGKLFLVDTLRESVLYQLAAPGDPSLLIYKPWTLVTQLFMHFDFMHLLFNMFGLYFVGRMFVQLFGERRLLTTYILGGVFGYLIHVLGFQFIPYFQQNTPGIILGASGSIFAIFSAIGFYKPNLKIQLFGIFPVSLGLIVFPFLILEFLLLTEGDSVARLAHIGGAVFGWISIINVTSPTQFMNKFDKLFNFKLDLKNIFQRKPKMKVYKGDIRGMTDEQYNANKSAIDERTNGILDKIAKKGYDGLSKDEKEFLFKQSQKNNS